MLRSLKKNKHEIQNGLNHELKSSDHMMRKQKKFRNMKLNTNFNYIKTHSYYVLCRCTVISSPAVTLESIVKITHIQVMISEVIESSSAKKIQNR